MLWLLFLFALALGAVSPSDGQESNSCGAYWTNFNGRCYKYVATHMTWADAEIHCVSQGSNLVSIGSMEEQNFVKTLIKNFDPAEGRAWIGLSDTQREGHWMWSDGCPARFFFWTAGEPNDSGNEDCVHTNFAIQRKWNDVPCSKQYAFVCASRVNCFNQLI
ncbi:lactose-binding lectin l-2-like [Notolabrus celidotus]|uniref:lactose-binding lectin l-2-like n=1 Tax=Notolabrus celidotus TaxID=1203425 RepID=UPI00149015A6|nr:lactose-binding lectin l-2-like [Notolabrus celidotus]